MKRNKIQNTQSIMDKPPYPHADTPSERYLYVCIFHLFCVFLQLEVNPTRAGIFVWFAHYCIPSAQKKARHMVCLQ